MLQNQQQQLRLWTTPSSALLTPRECCRHNSNTCASGQHPHLQLLWNGIAFLLQVLGGKVGGQGVGGEGVVGARCWRGKVLGGQGVGAADVEGKSCLQ